MGKHFREELLRNEFIDNMVASGIDMSISYIL